MIVWQEQVGKAGCGIACLAMVSGSTYARVSEEAPWMCDLKCGVDQDRMLEWLVNQGFAIRTLTKRLNELGVFRKPWPPKPFAPLHLCLVWQTKSDWVKDDNGRYYDNSHYVVMDEKGTVYDPADPVETKRKLKEYYKVDSVTGIYIV